MIMRLALGLMIMLPASLAVANAEGTGAHRPMAPRSLHVVGDDNYPPYLFRNDDGEVEGYLVDLWRLWERKTGVPVTLTATNWAEAPAERASCAFLPGRISMQCTVAPTGMFRSGSVLPTLIGASRPAIS